MRRLFALLLACLCLACAAAAAQTNASRTATVELKSAEAAPADWNSQTPPVDGWTPVKLMDLWDTRWPHHNGVVWYRLHWHQANTSQPVGMLFDYISLAGAMYVNGSEIHRDAHLVEPLTRTWNKPQYFLIDKPLLHDGDNELLVRVSGLVGYQPGLGTVTVGDPATLFARYQRGVWWRYDLQLFDQVVTLIFGGLFFIIWLMRRSDSSYGWYALSTLMSFAYGINYIADSTWPFRSTDTWEAINAVVYVAAGSGFALFLLRYCERRWPRLERVLLVLNVVSFALILISPPTVGHYRGIWFALGGTIYYAAVFAFTWHAVRGKRTDHRVLSICLMIPLLVSVHDFLLFYGVISDDMYLMAVTAPVTVVGMGFALAYRFAAAMKRVESFNLELTREVDAATRQLGETLQREHALALNNTRIGERLNLVRDLHDGFGGSLLAAITTLEDPRRHSEPAQVVATLKELRDDLRLIIDTTTHERDTDLAGQIAPLRHRWSQRLEAADIESRWTVEGVDELNLGAVRVLELLRFLQEALTNVLKHSRASLVDVRIRRDGDTLSVDVRDDGQGFDADQIKTRGAGLPSLRARATRLGAALHIVSSPESGTRLSFDAPLSSLNA
jgi:signal transduction histidine kinase